MKYIIGLLFTGTLLSGTAAFADGAEHDSTERIALGENFFEKYLSINDSQACASCHRLKDGFAGEDNLPDSPCARDGKGTRTSLG